MFDYLVLLDVIVLRMRDFEYHYLLPYLTKSRRVLVCVTSVWRVVVSGPQEASTDSVADSGG